VIYLPRPKDLHHFRSSQPPVLSWFLYTLYAALSTG
jgi:hypothetical protein